MKQPAITPAYVEAWKAGMDSRQGVMQDTTHPPFTSFRELLNCIVLVNGNIKTRPPVKDIGGTFSTNTQGLVYNKGAFYTFAKRGDTATGTGNVGSTVTVLRFDPPEYTSSWVLVGQGIFEGNPCAMIRHTYQSAVTPTRLFIHLFDSRPNEPTYIVDPAAPVDWSVGYPLWAYGTGTGIPGSWQDYTPVFSSAAEKLWLSRADANLAFSGIARGRVWNSRSADDIEKTGSMYYFTMPSGNTATWAIGEELANFTDIAKFAGYVVETINADGSWTKLAENAVYSGTPVFNLTANSPAWAPTKSYCTLTVQGVADGTIVRLRCNVVPEVTTVSGVTLSPGGQNFVGDGTNFQFTSSISFYAFTGYAVKVNGNTKTTTGPAVYSVTNVNGVARIDFASYFALIIAGSNASEGVTAAKVASGAGYTPGDVLTVVGGTFTTAAQITVNTVTAGAINTFTVTTPGNYFVLPTNPAAVTGGTGAGGTFNISFAGNPVNMVNTSLDYAAAIDTDFGQATLYVNGVKVTAGYALSNNAGKARVTLTPGLAIQGQSIALVLVPPVNVPITLDTAGILVSAGQIRYEGTIYTTPAFTPGVLAPSTLYYLCVGVTSAIPPVAETLAIPSTSMDGPTKYRHFIVATATTDGAGVLGTASLFVYAREAQTTWYVARHQLNLDYFAGTGEAAYINTSTHDNSGVTITTITTVKNRMVVCYPRSTQLWQTDPDPANVIFIDKFDFGTVDPTVLFYNRPVINTQRGVRGFDLTGLNFQSLEDTNIGEPLQYFGVMDYQSVAFWPWLGNYVAFGSVQNAAKYATDAKLDNETGFTGTGALYGFFILSFSKESGTLAWSFNPVPGLTNIDIKEMIPVDNRLNFRTGTKMYYLDAESTNYVDDVQATPIFSRAATHYNHLNSPNVLKRLTSMNIVMSGKLRIQPTFVPWLAGGNLETGAIVVNTQYGQSRVPLSGTGVAVSVVMTAETAAGFELQNMQIDYVQAGRS